MEKVFTFLNRPVRALMLMLAVAMCSLSASAGPAVDLGAIQLGEEYKVPSTGVATGTFTAPKSGTVTITGVAAHGIEIYSDEAMTQSVPYETTTLYFPYEDQFEAEAGQTYHIRITEQWWMELTVVFSMEGIGGTPLQIIDMFPAEGSAYDLASDGAADLQFTFNQGVKCDQGYYILYQAPDAPESVPYEQRWVTKNYPNGVVQVNGTLVAVKDVQANIKALMQQRGFKNCDIRVVLNNLTSGSGEPLENGKFMDANKKNVYFDFKVGELPLSLESVTKPEEFLSYWVPGNEAAKFEATFTGNISATAGTQLKVCYGDPEIDNGYYEGPVAITVEGNKISADLADVLRTPKTMLPLLGSKHPTVTLQLGPVCDEAGGSVIGNVSGSIGKFAWTIPYTEIERATVAFEFTPGTGASIAGKDNIELWVNQLNTVKFTGFKFEYTNSNETEGSVVVPVADAKFEAGDTDDEGTYTIPVPAEAKAAKGVTVTLDGLVSADGYDHFGEVKAVYGKMAITSAKPYANGATVEVLTAGTIINVETTSAAAYPEMVMVYEIEEINPTDPDEAIIKTMSYMTREEDGSYSSEVFGNYTLYTGHQYKVTFTAWATPDDEHYGESLGSDYIVWTGGTAPYTFSDVKLVSITPEPGNIIGADERAFTVVFDKIVNIPEADALINMGQGMTVAFESVEGIDPDTRYIDKVMAKEWVLTVPESYMNTLTGNLEFSFRALDQNDVLVEGNLGKEAQSRFYFSYDFAGRYADVDVVYENGKLIASHKDGLMPSWAVPTQDAYVMTKGTREVVAHVADMHCPIDDMDWDESADYTNTDVELILDNELPVNQAYILYLPYNYFNVGTEFNQKNSAEKYFAFTATAPVEPIELHYTTNPAEGVVESLSSIDVVFTDYEEVALGSGKMTLYCNRQFVKDLDDAEYDWDQYNKLIINLGEEYTEAGLYTIFVPEGYVLLGSEGTEAPSFTLAYTIEAGQEEPVALNITVNPIEGKVKSLKDIHIWFNDYDEAGLGAGKATLVVTDKDGNESTVTLADAEFGDDWNEMVQPLDQSYIADGKYEISFPAGYFLLGSNGVNAPAFKVTYQIGEMDGVDSITVEVEGKTVVFDLNGVMRATDSEQLNNLPAGIYIINGKKQVIK